MLPVASMYALDSSLATHTYQLSVCSSKAIVWPSTKQRRFPEKMTSISLLLALSLTKSFNTQVSMFAADYVGD